MASVPSATAQRRLSEQVGSYGPSRANSSQGGMTPKRSVLSLWEEMVQVKHESKTRRWEAVQTDRPSEMRLNQA